VRKRNTIYSLAFALLFVGAFLGTWVAKPAKEHNSDKESLEPCCKKGIRSNNTTWESLPQRFFSSVSY
jgi:hypothetical protein